MGYGGEYPLYICVKSGCITLVITLKTIDTSVKNKEAFGAEN